MATDGTPELSAKRCGEAIAQVRTARRWSRAQLIMRLYNELSSDDPCYESISETWLARLENGRMVKVPRSTVEALCRALRCSARERTRVLLFADRNILVAGEDAPTPVAEVLTYAMERVYSEAGDLLTTLLWERSSATPEELNELEVLELTAAALERMITRRRQSTLRQSRRDAHGALLVAE